MRNVIIIFLFFASCINPYDYKQDNSTNTLVVEGYVSNNPGDSEINLSWSGIFQRSNFDVVSNAELVVIENETTEYSFTHQKNGSYKPVMEDFEAKMENSYRLKIELDGQVYESDLVAMPGTLDIDNVSYRLEDVEQVRDQPETPSLNLYLTSNIVDSASMYYIYSFDETWKVEASHSADIVLKPIFIYDKDRNPINIEFDTLYEGNTTHCWASNKIEGINVLTTEGLSRNQIIDFPIFSVNLRSPRLLIRYSVLVNQYSINQEVHHFFKMLEEFSENSGFLYDIQPGYIKGNIQNRSTPEDNVIGMFYAASHNSFRIFISNSELSSSARSIVAANRPLCEPYLCGIPFTQDPLLPIKTIPNDKLTEALLFVRDSLFNGKGLSVSDYYEFKNVDMDYLFLQLAKRQCVDCRALGTNIEPVWWEEI